MPTFIDLSTPSPGILAILGAADFDTSGGSVHVAGDVNNDGFDDIIIGAYGNDAGGSDAGAAYVVFGRDRDSRQSRRHTNSRSDRQREHRGSGRRSRRR